MKDTVIRRAYAKINLGLDVTGVREDGYHLVRMIMQTIGLHDTLQFRVIGEVASESGKITGSGEIMGAVSSKRFEAAYEAGTERTDRSPEAGEAKKTVILNTQTDKTRIPCPQNRKSRITILSSDPEIPTGEDNLITKAIRCMYREFGISADLEITVEKRIPAAAGLAGGSSDAAAAFTALRELFNLDVSDRELQELALPLGADIPYCLTGGTQLAEGIGEVLTPLPDAPSCSVVLVKPGVSVPTGAVYKALDILKHFDHPDIDAQAEAIRRGNRTDMAGLCGNVLEFVTGQKYPIIGEIEHFFMGHGALISRMSGSGPSVFALYQNKETAEEAMNEFLKNALSEGCRCFQTDFADRDRIRTGVYS